mgnify:CR=1 FL=1
MWDLMERVGPVGLVGDAGGGKWGDMAGWDRVFVHAKVVDNDDLAGWAMGT